MNCFFVLSCFSFSFFITILCNWCTLHTTIGDENQPSIIRLSRLPRQAVIYLGRAEEHQAKGADFVFHRNVNCPSNFSCTCRFSKMSRRRPEGGDGDFLQIDQNVRHMN